MSASYSRSVKRSIVSDCGYVHLLVQDRGNDEGCVVHDDVGGVMVLNLVEPDKDEPTRSSLLMRARA